MTRLLTIGALLLAGMFLGSIPARAEYMRDEAGESSKAKNTARAGNRAARSSTRAVRSASRATRSSVRGKRYASRSSRMVKAKRVSQRYARSQQRRVASRTVATSSLTGGSYSGVASYYWQGQRTASGARFNPNGMTAAHRTLPFGTKVRVTSQSTGRSVVVTINDRGPFIRGRIIDLSRGAAGVIGMTGAGLARVNVAVLGR